MLNMFKLNGDVVIVNCTMEQAIILLNSFPIYDECASIFYRQSNGDKMYVERCEPYGPHGYTIAWGM